MIYAVIALAITNILTGVWFYISIKKIPYSAKRNILEINKALAQAQQYTDGKGWISIEWVSREQWISRGIK